MVKLLQKVDVALLVLQIFNVNLNLLTLFRHNGWLILQISNLAVHAAWWGLGRSKEEATRGLPYHHRWGLHDQCIHAGTGTKKYINHIIQIKILKMWYQMTLMTHSSNLRAILMTVNSFKFGCPLTIPISNFLDLSNIYIGYLKTTSRIYTCSQIILVTNLPLHAEFKFHVIA